MKMGDISNYSKKSEIKNVWSLLILRMNYIKKCIVLYSESVKFENRLPNLTKNTTQKTKDRATQAPL